MIVVLHNNNTRDSYFFTTSEALESFNKGGYEYTASIDTNDLDEAVVLSNNVTTPWVDGDKVTDVAYKLEGGARSLMVGDILLDEKDHYHLVATSGFIDLGKLPLPTLTN